MTLVSEAPTNITPAKLNIAPENWPSQKESSLPAHHFSGAMLNFAGLAPPPLFFHYCRRILTSMQPRSLWELKSACLRKNNGAVVFFQDGIWLIGSHPYEGSIIFLYKMLKILIHQQYPQQTIPKQPFHPGAWLQLNELHPICAYLTRRCWWWLCCRIMVVEQPVLLKCYRLYKLRNLQPSKQVVFEQKDDWHDHWSLTILLWNSSFWMRCSFEIQCYLVHCPLGTGFGSRYPRYPNEHVDII